MRKNRLCNGSTRNKKLFELSLRNGTEFSQKGYEFAMILQRLNRKLLVLYFLRYFKVLLSLLLRRTLILAFLEKCFLIKLLLNRLNLLFFRAILINDYDGFVGYYLVLMYSDILFSLFEADVSLLGLFFNLAIVCLLVPWRS